MSANFHTIIPISAAADPTSLNSPLGELDAAITRVLDSGTSFPGSPTAGDRFYRTDSNTLYVYTGSGWEAVLVGSAGATIDITGTAGENLSERDNVYLNPDDGEWYRIDIDADPPECAAERGVVAESGGIASSSTGAIRKKGVLSGYTGLTAGEPVFASTVAGGYTQTKPNPTDGGGQVVIAQMGFASSTTAVFVDPKAVEYVERESLANNGTLTIEHHDDEAARTRQVSAFIVSADAAATMAEYADSNQDVGVPLRGPSGAGATETIDQTGTSALIGDLGGTEYWQAQSFQCTAGRLSQITVTLDANAGSPTGDITWEIQTDSSGPSGSVLQTGTFTPTPSAQNTIPVTNGIFLAASTTYWLVLYPPDQSTGNGYKWTGKAVGTYANGQRAYSTNGGSSWTADAYDLKCSITTAAVSVGDKLAQSFQCTADTCDTVELYLKKVGTPTGTMTLRIETDSTGEPSGSLADANATVTLGESTLGTSYADVEFDFSTDFALSASTTYWLVLSTDRSTDTSNYVLWGSDASSPSYASGEMKSEASSTWSAESKDAVFAVLSPSVSYNEPCVIGRVSGGTRDVGVRFDDAGTPATDADTKTTFKNVTGSTVDLTCIVRLP